MRKITIIRVVVTILVTPFLVVLYLNIEKWAERRGYDLLLKNLVPPPGGGVVMQFIAKFLLDGQVKVAKIRPGV